MSLTVQQLLSDAKRLTSRLRDHDAAADNIITSAQDVLKDVEAMKQYQEDIDNLNSMAHNQPRAQLVLGIQQENRHIRQLQHENKELRAALEEHQNALELIMSKYRQHVTCLVQTARVNDSSTINKENSRVLQVRADKICEMASVMNKSIQIDDETVASEVEKMSRLITENRGLRNLLEISYRNGSYANPIMGPRLVSTACQTDEVLVKPDEISPPPFTSPPSGSGDNSNVRAAKSAREVDASSPTFTSPANSIGTPLNGSANSTTRMANSTSEEESSETSSISEDDEVTFNTIRRRQTVVKIVPSCAVSDGEEVATGEENAPAKSPHVNGENNNDNNGELIEMVSKMPAVVDS